MPQAVGNKGESPCRARKGVQSKVGVPQETHQPQGDAVRHRPTETRRPGRVTPPGSRAPTGQQPKAPPKCQPPTWGPPTFWPFTRKRDPEVSQQLSQPVCPLKFCPIEWNRRSPSFPCLDSKKGSKSRISILSTHVHRSSGLSSSRRWHLSPGVLHQLDQLSYAVQKGPVSLKTS